MDEPLSGLDSVNARLVLEALGRVARAPGGTLPVERAALQRGTWLG